MTITITINADNAAFQDSPVEEVTRILYGIKDAVDLRSLETEQSANLRDSNGNTVGKVTIN